MRLLVFLFFILGLISCQDSNQLNNTTQLKPKILIRVSALYEDTISVEYKLLQITEDSMVFKFPKIIPGTYQYYNAGDYISNLKCYDINNGEIIIKEIDNNSYLIPQSKKLKKIKYNIKKASATDAYNVLTKTIVLDSLIVVNPFSILGYFDKYKDIPHVLELTKPKDFYAFFGNKKKKKTGGTDSFSFDSYTEMGENPILYCRPDTISLLNSDINAIITVSSDNKNISASLLASWIHPLTRVLSKYTLNSVDQKNLYRFIFVFSNDFMTEIALEHNEASLFCFRSNWDTLYLKEKVQRFVTHEFLHTFTPINFHSNLYATERFDNFSSRHLWLYEGVTEYLSLKALLNSRQIDLKRFLKELARMNYLSNQMKECNNKSLLKISENILDKPYSECFNNFYYKAALVAFYLDIKISIDSKGKSSLISELEKYKKERGNIFDEKKFISNFFDHIKCTNKFDLRLLSDDKQLKLNLYLQEIGYAFSDNIIMGVDYATNDFGVLDYIYDNDTCKIRFKKNISFRKREIQLIKIDRQPINKSLLLAKLIFPANSKPVEIEFIEKGVKRNDLLKPEILLTTFRFKEIKELEKQTVLMKENLEYFMKFPQ